MTRLILMAACAVAATLTVAITDLDAQSPAPAEKSFEVATVKPNKTGDGRVMLGLQPGGRFTATNVPFRMLMRQAFNVQEFQIIGGPDWTGSERFDVVAKAPDGETFTAETMRPMLRALLIERFQLAYRNETRDMPVYALIKARGDGRLGPNLKPSATDCTAVMRGRRGGGPPPAPPQPGEKMECGFMIGPGRMNVGGMPLSNLAQALSPMVGRIVLDRTELTGTFDYELTFAPEALGGNPPPLVNGAPPPVDPNAPTLFTALQEQLGLKLDSQRGPVPVIVIDRVEPPIAD